MDDRHRRCGVYRWRLVPPSHHKIASFQLHGRCTIILYTLLYIFQAHRESMELARRGYNECISGNFAFVLAARSFRNMGRWGDGAQTHSKNLLVISEQILAYLEFLFYLFSFGATPCGAQRSLLGGAKHRRCQRLNQGQSRASEVPS